MRPMPAVEKLAAPIEEAVSNLEVPIADSDTIHWAEPKSGNYLCLYHAPTDLWGCFQFDPKGKPILRGLAAFLTESSARRMLDVMDPSYVGWTVVEKCFSELVDIVIERFQPSLLLLDEISPVKAPPKILWVNPAGDLPSVYRKRQDS